MARPIWTGVLSFGLVTLPTALYSATESHTVGFHQIQRGTADRVRNKRVNERTGEEVPYSEIVKGYELVEGEYVIMEPEELEQLSPGRSKTIDIRGFVDLEQVDPIFFNTTYYLGPKGKEYAKIYALLVKALERSNKAGISLFSMRGKEYLTAVRAEKGMLVAHTMHFADEVRDPHREVDDLPAAGTEVGERELAAARQLIDMLAVDWNPDEYHDTFSEQVRELIEAKAAGKEIAISQGPQETPTNVVDLMEVLDRSLATAKDRAAAGREPEEAKPTRGRARKTAPRPSRTPKAVGGKKTASTTAKRAQPAAGARKRTGTRSKAEDLAALTKAELYKRASDLDIPQRSTMTRDQLQHALEHAKHREHRLRTAS